MLTTLPSCLLITQTPGVPLIPPPTPECSTCHHTVSTRGSSAPLVAQARRLGAIPASLLILTLPFSRSGNPAVCTKHAQDPGMAFASAAPSAPGDTPGLSPASLRKRLTQCSVSTLILFVLGCLRCSHLLVPVSLGHQPLPVARGLDLVTCSQGTESGRVMVSVCLSVLQITGSRREPTAKSEAVPWGGPHGEQLKPSANSYTNELGNGPAGPIPLLAVCRLRIRFLCSYPSGDLPFPAA